MSFSAFLPLLQSMFAGNSMQGGWGNMYGQNMGQQPQFNQFSNAPWEKAAQATINVPPGRLGGTMYSQNPQASNGPQMGGAAAPVGSFGGAASGGYGGAFSDLGNREGSFLTGLLSLGGNDPYKRYLKGLRGINPELQGYLNQALGYLSPYQQTGVSALGDYYSRIRQMEDPVKFQEQILQSYKPSEAYKFRKQQGLQALENTAQATGYSGSGQELKNVLNFSQGLASQGQQQYLKNILGINQQALSGLGGISGMGLQAGSQMGDWTQQTAMALAKIKAQEAAASAAREAHHKSTIGSIVGSLF